MANYGSICWRFVALFIQNDANDFLTLCLPTRRMNCDEAKSCETAIARHPHQVAAGLNGPLGVEENDRRAAVRAWRHAVESTATTASSRARSVGRWRRECNTEHHTRRSCRPTSRAPAI